MLKLTRANPILDQAIHARHWPSPRATILLLVVFCACALAGQAWLVSNAAAEARALLLFLLWLLPIVTMMVAAASTARRLRSFDFQLIQQSPLSDHQVTWGLGLSTFYFLRVVLALAFGLPFALVDDTIGGGIALGLCLTGLHLAVSMLGTVLILRWGRQWLGVVLTALCCLLIMALLLTLNPFDPGCPPTVLNPMRFRLSIVLALWGLRGALPIAAAILLPGLIGWAVALIPWRGGGEKRRPQLEALGMILAVVLPLVAWVVETKEAEARERQALVALYRATGGEQWFSNYGWETNQPVCSWQGVGCACGRVAQIELPFNNMRGALPPEIGLLTNLQVLDLQSNQLVELPPEIGQMASLQWLVLYQGHLVELPPEIGQLVSLEWLALSGNPITELPPEIGQLTDLWTLNLADGLLTELPPEIGRLANLHTLDLGGNQLVELPPQIGQLTNLRELNLSGPLTELPPEIGQLNRLQKLSLSGSQFEELPPEIGRLVNLRVLEVRWSRLTRLPPEIGRLTGLQTLDLQHNQITGLPPEIGQLTSLQALELQENRITELPPEVGQLTNLVTLRLNNNHQLTELPPEIGQLASLQELSLGGAQLTELPPQVGQLTNLQTLDLTGWQPVQLPSELCQLPNLVVEPPELCRFFDIPEQTLALLDGILPCGVLQVEWGRHIVNLADYPQCRAAFPWVTVFCLTAQARWTDGEISITDISANTGEIIFETRREGLCGIFPQKTPAVTATPSPTWIPTQTAIPPEAIGPTTGNAPTDPPSPDAGVP